MAAQLSALGQDFYLDFGAFNVTKRAARVQCPLESELLDECVSSLCIGFSDVCPNNNGGMQVAEGMLVRDAFKRKLLLVDD